MCPVTKVAKTFGLVKMYNVALRSLDLFSLSLQ